MKSKKMGNIKHTFLKIDWEKKVIIRCVRTFLSFIDVSKTLTHILNSLQNHLFKFYLILMVSTHDETILKFAFKIFEHFQQFFWHLTKCVWHKISFVDPNFAFTDLWLKSFCLIHLCSSVKDSYKWYYLIPLLKC